MPYGNNGLEEEMNESELKQAVLAEREAARKYEAARRRVDELLGLVGEKDQRKRKPSRPEDFARACGL